ncbi:hypothetical protein [Demequina sp. NBRC 110054]|uniref:hypothetical protein n=1 Tax=Demequina sp. NBRC 110054 TaxID=1570343 RepID=UPI0011786706|nr:hypothetical protein [Demequina sp. NBRC 110054]
MAHDDLGEAVFFRKRFTSAGSRDTGADVAELHLREFGVLREEILFRMRVMETSGAAAISSTLTLSAIALTDSATLAPIILVAPFLGTFFMLVYTSQARAVRTLGSYIRDVLAPALDSIGGGEQRVLGWEQYLAGAQRWHTVKRLDEPTGLAIVLAQVLSIVVGFQNRADEPMNTAIWWFGVVATCLSLYWWVQLSRSSRRAS